MGKRLDLMAPAAVEEEDEEAEMKEAEEMCDLVSQYTKKALEWLASERLAGRRTTSCWGWASVRGTAGPQKRQAAPPPSLRILRSGKVNEEKDAEEMAQPPVKCVRREEEAPAAAAAATQIVEKEEEDGREAASASSTDGCSIRVVSVPTWDA